MADLPELRIQIRLLPVIGPGKVQLLESIDRYGSIAAAAREMGIAYPNAWKLIDSLNGHFKEPLVTRVTGGRRGGGAELTASGRAVLEIFRAIEAKARIMFAGDLAVLTQLLAPIPAPIQAPEPCEAPDIGMGSPECAARKRDRRGADIKT